MAGLALACDGEPEYTESPFVRPAERVELTESDLVNFDRSEIVVDLPWGTNRVSNDAVSDVGSFRVDSVRAFGYPTFDRVMLHVASATGAMPSHRIEMAASEAEVDCNAHPEAVRVILVHPEAMHAQANSAAPGAVEPDDGDGGQQELAGADQDGGEPERVEAEAGEGNETETDESGPRIDGVTEICPGADGRIQAVTVLAASEHRVMQLRDPTRLAIDIR